MPQLYFPKSAQRLRIYISESDHWRGKPLHSVLMNTMKDHGIAGVTILRGTAGYGAHSRVQSTSLEVLSMDLPVIVEAVDVPEKIETVLDMVYPMVREGLITLEEVQLIKYTHRYLNPLPVDRLVSECMTRDLVTFSPQMTVGEAWKLMLQHVTKAVPVVDRSGSVVGIVTDEDLMERAGIHQRLSIAVRLPEEKIKQEIADLEASPVRIETVMSQPVVTIEENDTLGNAISVMTAAALKRLPVINQNGQLCGMLSRLDILRQVVENPPAETVLQVPVGSTKTVGEIMRQNIPMVNEHAELPIIIEKMIEAGSYRLIVQDDEGKAIGLISDSDLIARVQPVKHNNILDALLRISAAPAGKETARDLMSPEPLHAPADLSIVDAVGLMLEQSRKWLVVVADDGRPLGLVDRQLLLISLAPDFVL